MMQNSKYTSSTASHPRTFGSISVFNELEIFYFRLFHSEGKMIVALIAITNQGPNSRISLSECTGLPHLQLTDDRNSTAPAKIGSPICFRGGNWHHLAGVRSGTPLKPFFDCAPIICVNSISNLAVVLIGNIIDSSAPSLRKGELDEVRLWTQARSLSEIQDQKSCLLSDTEPGLLAYWKMDQDLPAGTTNIFTIGGWGFTIGG